MRFELDIIEDVFGIIEAIRAEYDILEKMTIQINKREVLLTI